MNLKTNIPQENLEKVSEWQTVLTLFFYTLANYANLATPTAFFSFGTIYETSLVACPGMLTSSVYFVQS